MGVGIFKEVPPKELWSSEWSTAELETRWYFIIILTTDPPIPPPPEPVPHSGFGSSLGYPRTVRFSGRVSGHRFAQDGRLIDTKTSTWTKPSSATAGRRALIPGQPGVWLYIVNGVYGGRWVREGLVEALAE